MGEKDLAHAAAAEPPLQPISADAPAFGQGIRLGVRRFLVFQ